MKKMQHGFTLIELVVVIVILGILSATAIPKFANLERAARIATLDGMKANMQSAALMVHAQALVNGVNATAGWVDMNNNGTTTDADGDVYTTFLYPRQDYIDNAMDSFDGFTFVNATPSEFRLGGTNGCEVQYTPAANASTPPTYVIDNSGC